MKYHHRHIQIWPSEPTVNIIGAGRIIISWTILYTVNRFNRISETIDSINKSHFSWTLLKSIQKTVISYIKQFNKSKYTDIGSACSNEAILKERISSSRTSVWCAVLWKVSQKSFEKEDCQQVRLRIKTNTNNFWCCCASSISSVCRTIFRVSDLRKILNYSTGLHTGTWTKNRNGSKPSHNHFSFFALKSVVENKKILADIKYLSKFCYIGCLEVFCSVINKYCQKRPRFILKIMIVRSQLGVLDYNYS